MEIKQKLKEFVKKMLTRAEIQKGASQLRFAIFITILLPKVYFIHDKSRWFSTFYIVAALVVAEIAQRIIYKRFKSQIDKYYTGSLRIKAKKRG
jgi:predicted RNA-binding protein